MTEMETIASRGHLNKPIVVDLNDFQSGNHSWRARSYAHPVYCNICRDRLSGFPFHGYSCNVCKCKVHKRCADKAINPCKWTALSSIGKDKVVDKRGNILMIHQWMEGNLPMASKCAVCNETCGSILSLQDWRCLWCRATVHTACRPKFTNKCSLGSNRLSVLPPTAMYSIGSDNSLEAIQPRECSPLLVFVNSKSGGNQGVKFLKRFKQILNPAQVFDLIGSHGPGSGLRLFRRLHTFRVLVCSGDGSVGWVLSEIDRLSLQNRCQVGVLPLGTGNDLARVLGWGASCDDYANLPQILDKYERAGAKMLDRWSIMVYERSTDVDRGTKPTIDSETQEGISLELTISGYYNMIISHLNVILQSIEHELIVNTAKNLCDIIKDFIVCISETNNGIGDTEFNNMRPDLKFELNALLQLLQNEEFQITYQTKNETDRSNSSNFNEENNVHININEIRNMNILDSETTGIKRVFKNQLLERVNSLKKTVSKLIEHSENNTFTNTSIPLPTSQLLSPCTDNNINLQQLTPTSIVNPISISPMHNMLRRDSSCSTELNIESLPASVEFADCRQETIPNDQNSVLSEEDTSTCQTSQYDDLNSGYCQVYGNYKLTNECIDQNISEPLNRYPVFKICEDGSLGNICHIDSSEPAIESIPDSYKTCENKCEASSSRYGFRGAFSRDRPEFEFECVESDLDVSYLIWPSPEDEESEHFRKELRVVDNISAKKCSIAHSIEDNDISRRSINCQNLNKNYNDMEAKSETGFKNIKTEICKCCTVNMGLEVPNESNNILYKHDMNVRVQGSNGEIDDELHYFKKMAAPAIVANPPTPQYYSPNKICDVGETHLNCRRNNFDNCRRLSAASPAVMSNASFFLSSHRTSNSPTLNTLNLSPTSCSIQNDKSLKQYKRLPIINPLVTSPNLTNVTESSFISRALLANADALCAPAVPLMNLPESLSDVFFEKCAMSSYFGIGIDAKIALDFHHRREEHPEKFRSRIRNYMWYGVMGSKQCLQNIYKNLDQGIQLECDGQRIPLPALQGIVVLNIPSFMGGINFWGGTKDDRMFLASSFDDRILEVVAVFGTIQMAASRVINLQYHRIAQCKTVQINIMGDEGIPIQIDGESWIQPPGIIQIVHKNKMTMLCST